MRSPALVCVATAVLAMVACASSPSPMALPRTANVADTAFVDFSFARDTPASGVRLTACGRVTLSTTNTERTGMDVLRVHHAHGDQPTSVTLEFDRTITAFDLTVAGLRAGDGLDDFNVGSPPRLSGGLVQTADGHVTAGATGAGTLSWSELDTRSIKLTARGTMGSTISFQRFRATCRTLSDLAG